MPKPWPPGACDVPQGVFDPDADTEVLREIRTLSVELLEVDAALSARVSDADHRVLRDLERAYKRGQYVEPILVVRLGTGMGRRFVVVDGRARLEAARRAGVGQLLAEVWADHAACTWQGIRNNARPCQARTPADVRRATELAVWAKPGGCSKTISEHVNAPRSLVVAAMNNGGNREA